MPIFNFNGVITTNKSMTFDNFLVENRNRFAHALAIAVAKNFPKERYNPIYICGSKGVGKTHLIQAIRKYYFRQLSRNKYIIYNRFRTNKRKKKI